MSTEIDRLNAQFAIANHVSFAPGQGDLVVANINNADAHATIALQGAHVVTWQPHDQLPVVWVSDHAIYAPGKAIRGGVPICWPWFGPHPSDSSKPQHGFARTQLWHVQHTAITDDGATQVVLALHENDHTLALWPHAFTLELSVIVGASLRIELVARNTGTEEVSCSGALHSYFAVQNVKEITIGGLEGTAYLDKVDGSARKMQDGAITISSEVDRVYVDTTATCTINDPGFGRQIVIAKDGSRSTVVWNPWEAKARALHDFGDDEYREMVCVETTNAADDVVTIAPGAEHMLCAEISVKK